MASLHKFKLLATQCAVVSGSPTRSPTTSPVIHLRRRKTLRMLLSRTSDRRRIPRRDESSEVEEVSRDPPEKRGRRKLKDLFVSSPPFEDKGKEGNDREGFLPATGSVGSGFTARRGGTSPLRPVSATFRYRLLRRAWRPVLITIPE